MVKLENDRALREKMFKTHFVKNWCGNRHTSFVLSGVAFATPELY